MKGRELSLTTVAVPGLQVVWLFEGKPAGGSEVGAGDAALSPGEAAAAAAAEKPAFSHR